MIFAMMRDLPVFCLAAAATTLTSMLWLSSTDAFSIGGSNDNFVSSSSSSHPTHVLRSHVINQRHNHHVLSMAAQDDDHVPAAANDLTNTLARLDTQWKLQQQAKPNSRWTKLVLDNKNDQADGGGNLKEAESFTMSGLNQEYVYLLEPPNGNPPTCLLIFVGGAGLGTFPQIAYNEFLLRLSDRLGAAIVATPYAINNLDHFALSKRVGELTRQARQYLQQQEQQDDVVGGGESTTTTTKYAYSPTLPTYLLGHSLGCKLTSIYLAATTTNSNNDASSDSSFFDGVGHISYNNFGFSRTIGMAKGFATDLTQSMNEQASSTSSTNDFGSSGNSFGGMGSSMGMDPNIMNQVMDLAEMAVGMMGLEFTPSPGDMERLINLKCDAATQSRMRLFTFDQDNMDSTRDFVTACEGPGPAVSGLPGTHLTPVYFRFDVKDLPGDMQEYARNAMGGMESAAFGNEGELQVLVDEVSNWILGKELSRQPAWQKERLTLAAGAAPPPAAES